MSTPELVLESAMEVKWPESIPRAKYPEAIRLMLDMGALLRAAPEKRTYRKKEKPEEETAAAKEEEPNAQPQNKNAVIRALLETGRRFTTKELASEARCSVSNVLLVARAMGAKCSRGTGSQLIWQYSPTAKKPPAPRTVSYKPPKRKRRAEKVSPEVIRERVFRALASGPIAAHQLAKDIGATRYAITGALREAGARVYGVTGNRHWALPDMLPPPPR